MDKNEYKKMMEETKKITPKWIRTLKCPKCNIKPVIDMMPEFDAFGTQLAYISCDKCGKNAQAYGPDLAILTWNRIVEKEFKTIEYCEIIEKLEKEA